MRPSRLSSGAAFAAALALAPAAQADLTFTDFAGAAGLQLNRDAALVGARLRVAPAVVGTSGSAFATSRQRVVEPFSTTFTVELAGSGEGLAFVIQGAAATAVGGGGEGLGYVGIQNALVLELDTSASLLAFDTSDNELSWHSGGAGAVGNNEGQSLGLTALAPDFNSGGTVTVRIDYVPGSLKVYVGDTIPNLQVPLDIDATLDLPDGRAWVGFTAASSFATGDHDVLSWTFDEGAFIATGNLPPEEPPVTEPVGGGALQNPFDVHMEAGPYVDPDSGAHVCTDWEIWTMMPAERVWRTDCIDGPERGHSHLGDGVFLNSHQARTELQSQTAYVMRVRFRDDSGDPQSEWGPWAERAFQTGAANVIYALDTEDIVTDPAPRWVNAISQMPAILPAATPPHTVRLASAAGDLLLEYASDDGTVNRLTNPPALPGHVDVRLEIAAGGAPLTLGTTDMIVVTDDCDRVRVLLPGVALAAGQSAVYWISSDGGTWNATAAQTAPDFTSQARGQDIPWVAAQPGYEIEVVASGFQLPTNLAFVPNAGTAPGDPYLYVVELYGKIKVIYNDGSVGIYAENLLNYTPSGAFPGSGEQGMGGLVVDPQTGDLYAAMLKRGSGGGGNYPHVVKFTSLDGGRTAATQTTILDMPGEFQGQSHFVSHVELLPDRTLLVHMGDGFNAGTALNLSSYRGKILRVALDGSAPADNPLYDGAPITALDYVYAYGVRNPWGGKRRDSDGFHYCVENGPSIDRFSRIVPGASYGWAGADQHMQIGALYNWAPSTGPVNLAWIEPSVFGGSGFPADKQDHGFVTESGPTWAAGPQSRGKRITEFEIDSTGTLVSGPDILVQYAGTGRATVAGLAAGPDGLYFTDLYTDQGPTPITPGANVLRVRWRGADLGECGSVGQVYCTPAVLNSTGRAATIRARGSSALADNDLRLDVERLPAQALGYALASRTQGLVPQPGSSTGTLCLGGTIGRFIAQAQNSGVVGAFTVMVDLTQLPSPLVPVTVGETLNFQAWYRDFTLFPTSNFTDAVAVTIQ